MFTSRTFKKFSLLIAACALSWLAQPSAHAQTFPDKPVRVIVPFAPGNTLDASLRQVAEVFQRNTGQPLIVEQQARRWRTHRRAGASRKPRPTATRCCWPTPAC